MQRPVGPDGSERLAPCRRCDWAWRRLVEEHPSAGQVEVDLEIGKKIGAEQSVYRLVADHRQGDGTDKHSDIRQRPAAEIEGP